ncbi:MAG: c-type cytochrome [Anaerolineales bacterium]|nr:c-type cytochrome [Anaerolineales bacterium]
MKNKKFKHKALLLLIGLLALFLFGCIPTKGPASTGPASLQEIAAGDAENGRKLFMGYVHFQNEGPPCMGCHNVGAHGLLGGGALGPDLTNVSQEMTQSELLIILANYGFTNSPVMEPIYNEHPLTQTEQADLIAFLNSSAGEPEEDKELIVLGISILATVGAAIALGFVYRNRLRRIRKAMVDEATAEIYKN